MKRGKERTAPIHFWSPGFGSVLDGTDSESIEECFPAIGAKNGIFGKGREHQDQCKIPVASCPLELAGRQEEFFFRATDAFDFQVKLGPTLSAHEVVAAPFGFNRTNIPA